MFLTICFIYYLVMYKPWKQLNREISEYYYSSLIQIPVIYIQCYYMYIVITYIQCYYILQRLT